MIEFEYESWVVSTTSVKSPLFKVRNLEYDEATWIAVKKSSIDDIMDTAKQGFEPEQLAILIASINFDRAKVIKTTSYPKLKEADIVSGLKKIFSSTNCFDVDELLDVFEEIGPAKVEQILKSDYPVYELKDFFS